MVFLLLAMGCDDSRVLYPTTGAIYEVIGSCENGGAVINSQDNAVHLLGLEICTSDGCELNPGPGQFTRDGAMIHMSCDGYGEDAWLRARFLELDITQRD